MNYTVIISFLVISSFAFLQGRSKEVVPDSLAQPVGICQEVGLNPTGKSTQRAACIVLIMIRECLKSMQSQVSSNVKSN